jgi:cation diffusion facilitator family transporter
MGRLFKHVPGAEAGAAVASVVVSVVLTSVKFVGYYHTGSSAILSDAMENVVNVIASGVALYSLVVAHRPADEEHPYGHGKVEFMSAGFEGGMILLAGVLILVETVGKLVYGKVELEDVGLGLVLMAVAMAVNGALGAYMIALGRRQGSAVLVADGKHLFSDAVTSVGAIVALGVVKLTGWAYADPIAAIVIALYIGWTGLGLLRHAMSGLMDEQDLADEKLLRGILDSHVGEGGKGPRICSYHKLRHRHSGRYHWVDFHIMVPAGLNVLEGHEIASAIEWEIEKALGEGNATAHVEPCGGEGGCRVCEGGGEKRVG